MNSLQIAVIVYFVGLLLINSGGGADFSRYLDWSQVARSGDIFMLPGDYQSPMGVPITQWSHGPGFIFAIGGIALPEKRAYAGAGALFMGCLAMIAFWWAMAKLLLIASDGSGAWAAFGLAAAFMGAGFGFYSDRYSSESLSFAYLALLAYWLVSKREFRKGDLIVIGCLSGTLVLIRPYLAIFALVGFIILAFRLYWFARIKENVKQASSRIHLKRMPLIKLGIACIPFLLGCLQVLLTNRWMTGSIVRSPYDFGGNGFKSMDLANPHLAATLIHPWHGLLTYHPLYAIAFIATIIMIFKKSTPWNERFQYAVVTLAFLGLLYIQSCWYCWWLGTETFGMRGLAISGVGLIPIMIRFLTRGSVKRWIIYGFFGSIVISCIWSGFLMWQGYSQFMTYSELWAAQKLNLYRLEIILPAVAAVAAVSSVHILRSRKKMKSSSGKMVAVSAAMLATCIWYIANKLMGQTMSSFSGPAAVRWGVVATILMAVLFYIILSKGISLSRPRWSVEKVIDVFVIGIYICVTVLFSRLAVRTEAIIRNSKALNHHSDKISAYVVDEVEATYREYLSVPGFDNEKKKLRDFLDGHHRSSIFKQ
jgi:hypothetical protein